MMFEIVLNLLFKTVYISETLPQKVMVIDFHHFFHRLT